MMKILALIMTLFATSLAYADHHGNLLTTEEGMTLYTFDNDRGSESSCYDNCAKAWPPYMTDGKSAPNADWGTTTRKDGSKQWTYKGAPVYTWVGDKKPGDTTGDGVSGIWHIIKKAK